MLDAQHFIFTESSSYFQSSMKLRDFGGSQAFEFFPLAHVRVVHVTEGSELINNLARQINGAVTLHTRAQQNCQKFRITQRPRTSLEQLFPGPVVLRPAFDSG